MCEPLLTAVAEAGYAQRRAAEEGVGYYEGHPTRVALALMDEAGGARPDIVSLLRCLHEEGCPAAVQVRGWGIWDGGMWKVCFMRFRRPVNPLVTNPNQTKYPHNNQYTRPRPSASS
jgi:hypothetical protein